MEIDSKEIDPEKLYSHAFLKYVVKNCKISYRKCTIK